MPSKIIKKPKKTVKKPTKKVKKPKKTVKKPTKSKSNATKSSSFGMPMDMIKIPIVLYSALLKGYMPRLNAGLPINESQAIFGQTFPHKTKRNPNCGGQGRMGNDYNFCPTYDKQYKGY